MKWTHRPTGLGIEADRQVLVDGEPAGRTYRLATGPQANRWQWFGHWDGQNTGIADSLEAALAAIRAGWEQTRK